MPDTNRNYGATEDTSTNNTNDEKSLEKAVVPNDIEKQRKRRDPQQWRDLVAYWILGLCNNYGYVVMLSAAHDIIDQFDSGNGGHKESETGDSDRKCNIVSTGTILLADIIPSLVIKIIAPYIPFWVHVRVACAIGLAAGGFLLVAFAEADFVAILGVVLTSISSGLGETTFLGYSSRYSKNVVSTWSSGTGGAGIIGSLSYAGLQQLGVSPMATMLIMLFFPAIEAVSFWLILRSPRHEPDVPVEPDSKAEEDSNTPSAFTSSNNVTDDRRPLVGFRNKMHYTWELMKYMMPLTLVYFFEYFINQGLFELVNYENIFLDKSSQYRWLQVDYQIGVFISRSSVNVFQLKKIWLMSIFQFINVVYFLIESIFYVTPNIWIVFAVVLWEGLLGGGAYVNTFYRMSKEIPRNRQVYAMAIVAQADSLGIAVAGLISIPVHNAICGLAAPNRWNPF